ncbi:hypothetical protein B0H13DRAFT_1888450 [Mycena leptocephala]|nr:hypothetical protein B0H13DRAFT_1888450 [Mycena leptocephala]
MTSSSTSSTAMSLFTKRRRAYVACANCRKRKIKVNAFCVTVSTADYSPCTQCAIKGLKCEYSAVPDDYPSSQPTTPPPEIDVPPRERTYAGSDAGWTLQPIVPPLAGINDYLGSSSSSSSRGVRRGSVPPAAARGSPRYPYQRRGAPASAAMLPAPSSQQQGQPAHVSSASGYAQDAFVSLQGQPSGSVQQYYTGDISYLPVPDSGYGSSSFYAQDFSQAAAFNQPGGMPQVYQAPWLEAMRPFLRINNSRELPFGGYLRATSGLGAPSGTDLIQILPGWRLRELSRDAEEESWAAHLDVQSEGYSINQSKPRNVGCVSAGGAVFNSELVSDQWRFADSTAFSGIPDSHFDAP